MMRMVLMGGGLVWQSAILRSLGRLRRLALALVDIHVALKSGRLKPISMHLLAGLTPHAADETIRA